MMCNDDDDDDDDDWRETTSSRNTHGNRRRRMTTRNRCIVALVSHLVLMYASFIMCVVVVQGQVVEEIMGTAAAAAIGEESSPQQHWIFTSDKPPPLRRYRRQLEPSNESRQAENTSTPLVDRRELHDLFGPEVRLGTGDLIQSSLSYSYENKLTIQLNFKIQVTKEEVHRNREQTGFLDTIQSGLQESMKEEFELLNNRFLYDNHNNNMPNMAPAVVTNIEMGEEETETMAVEETSYQTLIPHERRSMSFVRDDHPPRFDAVVQNRRHCPENVDCYFLQVTMTAFPERGDDDGEIKQAL
eukprot:scaffold413725_cov44-Attheya_sp.AAC.1